MRTFFTSDTHFFHHNIIEYTGRPFNDVDEMNQKIIESWNHVVNNDDIVRHMGDISFGSPEETLEIVKQLKGRIILIKGNHDRNSVLNRLLEEEAIQEVIEVGDMIKLDRQKIHLTHYPLMIGERKKLWSVHGHTHNKERLAANHINVTVDSLLSKSLGKPFGEPFEFKELLAIMEKRKMEMQKPT